mgnify:CR=1 FL=1
MSFFEGNHLFALCTAFTSIGGYAPQPIWWYQLSQYFVVQIFALTVLIYQGGGGLNWGYSLSIALLFTILLNLSKYVTFNQKTEKSIVKPIIVKDDEGNQISSEDPEA